MTERQQWIPEDPVNEPIITLRIGGEREVELNRLNTSLFRFMGKLAVYNHIFYADIHEEEVQESFYMFRFNQGFDQVEQYMLENDFTVHNNLTEVSGTDIDAYMRAATTDINDIPSEWIDSE